MKRWIVNAAERTVREQSFEDNPKRIMRQPEALGPGEFFWDGTYADAMAAGQRRRLAEEALGKVGQWGTTAFALVGDRIEPLSENLSSARENGFDMFDLLNDMRYDVWREGLALVVLGRLP